MACVGWPLTHPPSWTKSLGAEWASQQHSQEAPSLHGKHTCNGLCTLNVHRTCNLGMGWGWGLDSKAGATRKQPCGGLIQEQAGKAVFDPQSPAPSWRPLGLWRPSRGVWGGWQWVLPRAMMLRSKLGQSGRSPSQLDDSGYTSAPLSFLFCSVFSFILPGKIPF